MGLRHAIPRSFQGFLSPSTRLVTARWVFVGDLYVLRKDAWQGDGQFGSGMLTRWRRRRARMARSEMDAVSDSLLLRVVYSHIMI